jgi:hypothetical protein
MMTHKSKVEEKKRLKKINKEIFNSRSEEHPCTYNEEFLESVDQLKYLGLIVDRSANMKYAAEAVYIKLDKCLFGFIGSAVLSDFRLVL